MGKLYLEDPTNTFTAWTGQPINDIRYPLNIGDLWSAQELEAIGLCEPLEADPITDEWTHVTGTSIQRLDGVVKWVNETVDEDLDKYKINNIKGIINLLDILTSPLLSAYPQAEKEVWVAKESEALAFSAIPEIDQTIADAPFIAQIVAGQFPEATEAETLQYIRDKATVILTKASEWRGLSAYIEAVRSKTDLAILASTTHAEVKAIADATKTEIYAFGALKGLL